MGQKQNSLPKKVRTDVELLEAYLSDLPPLVPKPVLVLVCGLPGAGKSFFSHQLVQRVPLALIQSDIMRKALFTRPTYSKEESTRLFGACHGLIHGLLKRRVPVLFDATNLVEQHREFIYRIAFQLNAKLIIVFLTASEDVVKARLSERRPGGEEAAGSEADWQVYEKMRPTFEPLHRSHYVVDTSKDIGHALEKVAREVRRTLRTAS